MKKTVGAVLLAATLAMTTAACELEEDGTTAADRAEVNQKKNNKRGNDGKAAGTAKKATKAKAPEKSETVSQEQARKKAASYLDYSAFSRKGLIEQLEFEGFSNADAVYGVDAQKANWMKQAAAKAESYLDYSAFSRQGLVDQLLFEGFTREQAEHGASAVGL